MKKVIGVIGLGNMGSAIAKRLFNNFTTIGFDIDEKKRSIMNGLGISTCDKLEDIAKRTNIIVLSMPNAKISLQIINNIAPLLSKNSIIIETSTILPSEAVEMLNKCSQYDIKFVDAAILGGVSHMESKTATLLVGDSNKTINQVKDVLETISNEIIEMGNVGSGMAAKIINNGVAHAVMSVITESAALAVKLGISPAKISKLLAGETALIRPLTHRYNERIRSGKYEGGMSTANAKKDSTLFLNLAQQNQVPLFTIQGAHSVYEIATQTGYGEEDYAAIAKLWEVWNEIDFTASEEVNHDKLQNAY